MIMPEDNITCVVKNHLGFSALYDSCGDNMLSEGVTLVAISMGITYIFQTDEVVDVLTESSVSVMMGTLFEYLETEPCEEEIDYFPIVNCRFPTKDELEWYNKMETV